MSSKKTESMPNGNATLKETAEFVEREPQTEGERVAKILMDAATTKWKENQNPALILENDGYTDAEKVQNLLWHGSPKAIEILDKEWKSGRLQCDVQNIRPGNKAGYEWLKEHGLDITGQSPEWNKSYLSALLMLSGNSREEKDLEVILAVLEDGFKSGNKEFQQDCHEYFSKNKEAFERLQQHHQDQKSSSTSTPSKRNLGEPVNLCDVDEVSVSPLRHTINR